MNRSILTSPVFCAFSLPRFYPSSTSSLPFLISSSIFSQPRTLTHTHTHPPTPSHTHTHTHTHPHSHSHTHLTGAHEIRSMLQQDVSSFAEHHTVQTRLDDFYMSRIGIRMVLAILYFRVLVCLFLVSSIPSFSLFFACLLSFFLSLSISLYLHVFMTWIYLFILSISQYNLNTPFNLK